MVIVLVDALRRDHLGLYGYERPTSPFLDRLSAEGVVFEEAFSQAPQTFNSTAALFTSRLFPWTAVVADGAPRAPAGRRRPRPQRLLEANTTLAEVFAAAGYDTLGLFTNPHHHPTSGFWQGFSETAYLPRVARGQWYATAPAVRGRFLDWLGARDRGRPYFAYLHLMDVHSPYRPPPAVAERFVRGAGRLLYVNGRPDPERAPAAADVRYMTDLYDAGVAATDGELRLLVEGMQERGAWRNLILVLLADHGDEFMEHGGLGHGRAIEPEQLAVPLVFWQLDGAGKPRNGGRRVTGLARLLDVAPTLLELAGVAVPAGLEGVSLASRIQGRPAPLVVDESLAWIGDLRALITDRWYFICRLGGAAGGDRLYDRSLDPTGTRDVAVRHPEIVRALRRRVAAADARRRESVALAERLLDLEGDGGALPIDPDLEAQLRALGYLD